MSTSLQTAIELLGTTDAEEFARVHAAAATKPLYSSMDDAPYYYTGDSKQAEDYRIASSGLSDEEVSIVKGEFGF